MKFTFFNNKAQGTIEYLVIIAIVVVIALVVVGLLINQVDNSSNIASTSSEIASKVGVGGLSLGDSVAGIDTNGLLVLKNIDSENLTLSKIVVDGVDHNFSTQIVAGDEKGFKLQDVASCVGDKKNYSVKIEYVSSSGLTKVADFGNISLDCASVVTPTGAAIEETITTASDYTIRFNCATPYEGEPIFDPQPFYLYTDEAKTIQHAQSPKEFGGVLEYTEETHMVTFTLPNGTYYYTAGGDAVWELKTGSITVSGADANYDIIFIYDP